MFLDVFETFYFLNLTIFALFLSIFGFGLILCFAKIFAGSDLSVATAASSAAVRHLNAGNHLWHTATAEQLRRTATWAQFSSAIFRNSSNFRPAQPLREIFQGTFLFSVVYSRPYRLYKLILHFVVNKFGGMKWWTVSLGFSFCFLFVFALIFQKPVGDFCVLKMFSWIHVMNITWRT